MIKSTQKIGVWTMPCENRQGKVRFGAMMSRYDNCTCDACHAIESVMKLTLPYTKYHGGGKLTTKTKAYWLCCSCYRQLEQAMLMPQEESIEAWNRRVNDD